MMQVFPGAFILIALLNAGSSLKCYRCSSVLGGNCDSPLNTTKTPIKECPFNQNRCLVVNDTYNGIAAIRRDCVHEHYCPGNTRIFAEGCSDCNWDLCNPSTGLRANIIINVICLGILMHFMSL